MRYGGGWGGAVEERGGNGGGQKRAASRPVAVWRDLMIWPRKTLENGGAKNVFGFPANASSSRKTHFS